MIRGKWQSRKPSCPSSRDVSDVDNFVFVRMQIYDGSRHVIERIFSMIYKNEKFFDSTQKRLA